MKQLIQGVLPPMITPFTAEGAVDYDAFVYNIEKWNATGLAGYLVLGSNSETVYLTEEEKLRLVRLAAEAAGEGKYLMVGSGAESIADTIRFTNKAAACGMQSALVLTPSYYGGKMTSAALVDYFTQVADASDIPILIYNVPKFTHVNIGADAIAQLSRHPNILGMKDSAGDAVQLANFKRVAAEGFQLMVGTAGAWYFALTLGIRAGIHALANCCPEECVEMQRLFDAGDAKASLALYLRMLPVNAAVTGTYGIAGLKHVCSRLGYHGGYVRSPLQPLTRAEEAGLEAVCKEAGIL